MKHKTVLRKLWEQLRDREVKYERDLAAESDFGLRIAIRAHLNELRDIRMNIVEPLVVAEEAACTTSSSSSPTGE